MGKLIEDYDIQINTIRTAYIKAALTKDWQLAAHFVYMMHNCLRPKFRIKQFQPFYQKDHTAKTELAMDGMARRFCLHWEPLIEAAISTERDLMLRSIEQ